MLTTFPIDQVQALRAEARHASQVSSEGPEGWSKSDVDPMRLLAVFTSLGLKPGYVLRAYQFRSGDNGNGIIWALKKDDPFPEPDACPRLQDYFLAPPRPAGALDSYMEAIQGDGTPWSYFSASLFAREASEFGALWHGSSWSDHDILAADPWSSSQGIAHHPDVQELGDRIASLTLAEAAQLSTYLRQVHGVLPAPGSPSPWLTSRPAIWLPSCRRENALATVVFYTFTAHVQERVIRHRDTFREGEYTIRYQPEVIAVGGQGYVH